MLQGNMRYYKYKENGFDTPSGKFEIYSGISKELGLSPLPEYREPALSPVSSPDTFKAYPLILTTGVRSKAYFVSEGRQIKSLRKINPDPWWKSIPRPPDLWASGKGTGSGSRHPRIGSGCGPNCSTGSLPMWSAPSMPGGFPKKVPRNMDGNDRMSIFFWVTGPGLILKPGPNVCAVPSARFTNKSARPQNLPFPGESCQLL